MTVLRTVFPGDAFTAWAGGNPYVIDGAGVDVPDELVVTIRAQAQFSGVELIEGGITLPTTQPLTTRVAALEQVVQTLTRPLVEQAVRTTAGDTIRSGQFVPVDTTDAPTAGITVTVEAGGTGSRAGVRVAAGNKPVIVTGPGLPTVTLSTAGSVVLLDGVTGGGWRVTSVYDAGGVPWSKVTDKPSIPSQFSDLNGSVSDLQIPATITRDSELTDGLSGKSNTGHTHPYSPTGHTHPPLAVPTVEVRLTSDYTALSVGTYFAMRGNMAPPTGMDPSGMWSQPAGAGQIYQMTIPSGWDGRWELFWQIAADGHGYNSLLLFGLLNAPDNIGNNTSIADYIAFRNQVPGMGQCGGSAMLAAGDKIALGAYSAASSGTWNMRAVLGNYHRTKAVLAYRGPS